MMPCAQCNTELVAPERSEYWSVALPEMLRLFFVVRSEYWSDRHACHIWLCPRNATPVSRLWFLFLPKLRRSQ
jgi:hypothetical protein